MILNDQQLAVVNSTASRILCLAGAGTGKTRTLIARIQHLVETGVDPRSILVLTFTNAAALEMERRYSTGKFKPLNSPKFATFHSFCYGLIASDAKILNTIGYSSVPEVASAIQIKEIKSLAEQQCNLKATEKKDEMKRKLYYQAFKRLLKQRNLITFDNMCYDICQLFVNNLPPVWRYKNQYKYILVDEYQDTDEKQHKFIMSFDKSNLMVVGDALQALYGFRGATSEIIKQLASDSNWEVHRLSENYRSTIEICEFANSMSGYADDKYRVTISGHGHGDNVTVISRGWEWRDKLLKLIDHESDTALLCRTNSEVDMMCDFLKDHNVAFTTARSPEYVINMCKAAIDSEFLLKWAASLLPADQYNTYIRESALDAEYSLEKFYKQFATHYNVRSTVDSVMRMRKLFNERPANMFDELSQILDMKVPNPLPEDSTASYLDRIASSVSGTDGTAPLYVGTVHSVKGLEFDSVFVFNVGSRSFKLNCEDNWNVYYVAITRAKNHLTIFKIEE